MGAGGSWPARSPGILAGDRAHRGVDQSRLLGLEEGCRDRPHDGADVARRQERRIDLRRFRAAVRADFFDRVEYRPQARLRRVYDVVEHRRGRTPAREARAARAHLLCGQYLLGWPRTLHGRNRVRRGLLRRGHARQEGDPETAGVRRPGPRDLASPPRPIIAAGWPTPGWPAPGSPAADPPAAEFISFCG